MTNVVKFPRHEDSKPQQGQPVENAAGQTSGSAMLFLWGAQMKKRVAFIKDVALK